MNRKGIMCCYVENGRDKEYKLNSWVSLLNKRQNNKGG